MFVVAKLIHRKKHYYYRSKFNGEHFVFERIQTFDYTQLYTFDNMYLYMNSYIFICICVIVCCIHEKYLRNIFIIAEIRDKKYLSDGEMRKYLCDPN